MSLVDPFAGTLAPNFKVLVDGQELDEESRGDVLDLKVTLDCDGLSQFDLTLNNWNDRETTFKYSDFKKIDLLSKVGVRMGYANDLVWMVNGLVTTLNPQFPDGGPPTIAVSGEGLMYRMKNNKPGGDVGVTYEPPLTELAIVEQVATVRHGLPVHRDPLSQAGKASEPIAETVVQKNQDDATFLRERAGRLGFVVYVQTDPDTGVDELFFHPKPGSGGNPRAAFGFKWGHNLISFTPTLTVADQVGAVTVRGWDPDGKRAIEQTAKAADVSDGGDPAKTGPGVVAARLGDGAKQEVIVSDGVKTDAAAKQLAVALLRERGARFSTATGKVIGLPRLRPGDAVDLDGLGSRFNDRYLVTKVTHTLGGSGFLTEFTAARTFDGRLRG